MRMLLVAFVILTVPIVSPAQFVIEGDSVIQDDTRYFPSMEEHLDVHPVLEFLAYYYLTYNRAPLCICSGLVREERVFNPEWFSISEWDELAELVCCGISVCTDHRDDGYAIDGYTLVKNGLFDVAFEIDSFERGAEVDAFNIGCRELADNELLFTLIFWEEEHISNRGLLVRNQTGYPFEVFNYGAISYPGTNMCEEMELLRQSVDSQDQSGE